MRIGNLLQQDLRGRWLGGATRLFERSHESGQVLFEQVVTQVHDEVVVTEKVAGYQYAMRQTERGVLRNERDARTESRAVTERRHHFVARVADDHTDLGDAGRHHGLDSVEEDRLVGHRHELFGARVGDGPQPSPGSAGENESFHGRDRPHPVRPLSFCQPRWTDARDPQPLGGGGSSRPAKYLNTVGASAPSTRTDFPPISSGNVGRV